MPNLTAPPAAPVTPTASTLPGLTLEQAATQLETLKSSEEHFDGIKAQCRQLASAWLMATFGAMGFALTETFSTRIAAEVVVLALSLAGATGIGLLWVLDLLVYHRLLDASFIEASRLEAQYPQLPQVRRHMRASQPGGQTLFYERWFYMGGITAPVLLGGALFVYWAWGRSPALAWASGVMLATGLVAANRLVWLRSPNPYSPPVD